MCFEVDHDEAKDMNLTHLSSHDKHKVRGEHKWSPFSFEALEMDR